MFYSFCNFNTTFLVIGNCITIFAFSTIFNSIIEVMFSTMSDFYFFIWLRIFTFFEGY